MRARVAAAPLTNARRRRSALRRATAVFFAVLPPQRATKLREGEKLYAEKPTLRGEAGVTWSDDEYGHAGLQRMCAAAAAALSPAFYHGCYVSLVS